jgi:hypothetical protein
LYQNLWLGKDKQNSQGKGISLINIFLEDASILGSNGDTLKLRLWKMCVFCKVESSESNIGFKNFLNLSSSNIE